MILDMGCGGGGEGGRRKSAECYSQTKYFVTTALQSDATSVSRIEVGLSWLRTSGSPLVAPEIRRGR